MLSPPPPINITLTLVLASITILQIFSIILSISFYFSNSFTFFIPNIILEILLHTQNSINF